MKKATNIMSRSSNLSINQVESSNQVLDTETSYQIG